MNLCKNVVANNIAVKCIRYNNVAVENTALYVLQ